MRLIPISPDIYKGTNKNKYVDFIDRFGGYNRNARINENEFYDMQNMCSDLYPIASVRQKRGDIPASMLAQAPYNLISNKGMIYKGGFYYISIKDDSSLSSFNICLVGPATNNGVTTERIIAAWMTEDTDTVRQIVPMGAKMIILPDNVVVNTTIPLLLGNAEPIDNVTQSAADIRIQPCFEDGTVMTIDYAGDNEPETPFDGYVWLDTKFTPASLKKFYASSGMWQPFLASYVKITDTTASGNNGKIGKGFAAGDGIDISGITVLLDLNKNTLVKKISDNERSVVISATMDAVAESKILIARETVRDSASLPFLCKSSDFSDLVGKDIKVGGNEIWRCYSASVSQEAAYTYETGDRTISKSVKTMQSLTTADQKADAQNNYKILLAQTYVSNPDPENDVADGDDITWASEEIAEIVGQLVRFGKDGEVAKISAARIDNTDSSNIKYEVTLVDPKDTSATPAGKEVTVPAGTVVYAVSEVEHPDMTMGVLTFGTSGTDTHTIYVGEKGCATIETQYVQAYSTTEGGQTVNHPVTFSRKMPKMDYIIESQNRLWGCRYGTANNGEFVNEIYCSKLGDEKNWEVYQGISTDSYRASVGTEGEWTGAVNFRGYPVFFKEHHIHSILGVNPPYQINHTDARGVQKGSAGSLAMLNEVLYYKSIHGICAYSGNLPSEVSYQLGDIQYKDAVACAYKNKYYISMKDMSGNPAFFVYDTAHGLWHKEDDLCVHQFAVADDDVYFIKADATTGALFGTGGKDTNETDWYIETGEYGLSLVNSKYISRLNLRLMLPVGSYMFISIMYDSSNEWETVGSVMGHGLAPFTLPIKPRRCDHFRLRLEGHGDMRLYSISKTISQGSDR